ncbi:chemotaxis protein CheW [Massilia niastensis]|uniref:chemotaxis protein CheW n=1 Tax=Massilia niastensis TaxID=544911 RepID=UPI000378BA13|nr:chemotaxis protein CheW [Massilia niastensis]
MTGAQDFDWAAIARRLELSMLEAEHGRSGADVLRERSLALARPAPPLLDAMDGAALEVLAFEVAGERYAVETRWVAQATRMPALTALPGMPNHVAGIAAFRGQVVAVLDLRTLLALPLSRLTEPAGLVILQGRDMEFALLADAVTGVQRYPRAALPPGLPAFGGRRGGYLLGVAPDQTAILDGAAMLGDASLVVHWDQT